MAKKSKKSAKAQTEDQIVDVTDAVAGDDTEAENDVTITEATAQEECLAPLKAQVEALLMVTDEPMTVAQLANLIGEPIDVITGTLNELAESYIAQERGFELRNIAQGWRFYSARTCAPLVARYATDGQTARLTQASLETLSVVAYKQPVSRARVSAIRGVNVDGVMRTLLTRGLIAEVETDPATGALLYGTTPYFLERMGIKSITELPPVEDHLPDMSVVDDLVETVR